jgi:hypothetical protein
MSLESHTIMISTPKWLRSSGSVDNRGRHVRARYAFREGHSISVSTGTLLVGCI